MAPLPVTVIGGYLGAGKTTLVNHLLRHPEGRRLAVLVNEFGDLPIDADLIERRDEDMIAIAGGCVCCSYGSDLIEALERLLTLDPRPDHLLIEASGVALPGGIASSLTLLMGYRLDAVLVLADAETIRARAADRYLGDTIARQLADADLVLLNKADLVSSDYLAETGEWLAGASPRARIVTATNAAPPADLVLGIATERLPAYEHAHHHHSAGYDTASFPVTAPADAEALARALADPALELLRAKGFVPVADGRLRTIQTVAQRWSVSAAPVGLAGPGRLVAIALPGQLDRDAIQRAIATASTG
ncbi:CobW family GTP-binding protein [Oceanibaculum nanhaiense]|uniref:CobW family GTP-binding protein n=1 Tax=Oceanibaculum nanhaiense TaxID=1909734 RepID=UPI003F72C1A9